MRFTLYLLTAFALFWQSVFALPTEGSNAAALPPAAPIYNFPVALVDPDTYYPPPGHLEQKRALGFLAKAAKKVWSKIRGKPDMPRDEAKWRKAAKADMDKWRPHVAAQRLKNGAAAA